MEKNFWGRRKAAESTRKFANELFEGAVSPGQTSDKRSKTVRELESGAPRERGPQHPAAGDSRVALRYDAGESGDR